MNDPLPDPSATPLHDNAKRRVVLCILTACVSAGWLNLMFTGERTIASVVAMLSITIPIIVLALWPRTLHIVESLMALTVTMLYMLMLFTALVLQPSITMTTNFAVLAPSVYVLAFLLLGVRRGLRLSLTFLAGTLALTMALLIPHNNVTLLPGTLTILSSFFVISIVNIACLFAFAFYLERHAQARSKAEAVARFAYADTLTGLPNRLLFQDRLEHTLRRAQRNNERFALLFIDLDDFKGINDTHGHQAGDHLLQQFARRLQSAVRASDTAARISGDEFAIIAENVSTEEDAVAIAQKIMLAFSPPFEVANQPTFVTSSIGVSLYPVHGDSTEQLLARADQAMYLSKSDGRNAYRVFSEQPNAGPPDRRTLERELRHALQHQALKLHYQPIYDVENGTLTGMEALARWTHATFGNIPPNEFIPVAEETQLIVPLGEWVLQEACRQNVEWQRAGHPPVAVAVNVSALQFDTPDFVDTVKRALAHSGLAPQWLELELTETAVLNDAAVPRLAALKELGVRVSLDDFGTGYSSLSQLQRLPISGFKIDRSFINDLTSRDPVTGSRRVVKIIMMLAEALELKVVAEGIETGEQLDEIKRTGCGHAQGYWLSRPLPPDEAENLLKARFASTEALPT